MFFLSIIALACRVSARAAVPSECPEVAPFTRLPTWLQTSLVVGVEPVHLLLSLNCTHYIGWRRGATTDAVLTMIATERTYLWGYQSHVIGHISRLIDPRLAALDHPSSLVHSGENLGHDGDGGDFGLVCNILCLSCYTEA